MKATPARPQPAASDAWCRLPAAPLQRRGSTPAPPARPVFSCACGGGCPRCAAQAVAAGLASPASALPTAAHRAFGAASATGLARVRVHAGGAAAASAKALAARAYAVGAHIVLGAGIRADARDPTLRHELAHAQQQQLREPRADDLPQLRRADAGEEGDAERAAQRSSPPRLRRPLALALQSVGLPLPTSPSTGPAFADIWRRFEIERWGRSALARELAVQALREMTDLGDRVAHGMTLATFFFDTGMNTEGLRALDAARSAWMLRHVSADQSRGGVPPMSGLGGLAGGPEQLITHAEAAARRNDHTLAFTLFGSAFQMLSWQLDAAGPRRVAELESRSAAPEVAATTRSLFHYPLLQDAYRQLRRILGFYRALEAERRAAGDADGARHASGLSLLLYLDIKDNWAWDSDAGVIAEVEHVVTPRRGDALRIQGANSQTLDVTQLPGLTPPREVAGRSGGFTYQRQSLPAITDALFGQTELMAALQAEPAIQREFGAAPIDINDLGQRLRVWRTMFGVYQAAGDPALPQLMSLIGRYLRAYTIHTAYDVDDFGVSYLADDMRGFPTDLAARAERDCGVYALTVAYEVFRTARTASPRLDLDFRLFTTPDHVTLVIDDRGTAEHYIVNNDTISPPQRGDAMEGVARAYAPIRGRADLVTPAMETSIGTTALGDAAFRTQAWRRYRDNASWGIHVPGNAPGEALSDVELRERAYREFYAAQRFYDEGSAGLRTQLDALAAALSPLDAAARAAQLRTAMPAISQSAVDVGLAFERAGPFAPLDTARPDRALQRRLAASQRFLFRTAEGSAPLARAAMALLHWQSSGSMLTPLQQGIVALCDRVPSFHAALQAHRGRGSPASF